MSQEEQFLRVVKEDGVAEVVIDRPPMNTLDYSMYEQLNLLAEELDSDPEVRSVLFRSAHEKVFVSGADIAAMRDYDRRRGASARKVDTVHSTFLRIQRLGKPTVAVIAGHALGGGCELALCMDLRVMAQGRARIGLPEISLGIVPGGGGTQRLARLVGRAAATEMLLLGKRLDAEGALAIGLVSRSCPDAQAALAEGRSLARQLAEQSPTASRLIKRALNDGVDGDLVRGLSVEREAVIEALAGPDAVEGFTAFLEKRPPQY
ncbi:MAG: enoyl-CoA hydratase/isomerase family protein [Nostocoides sp.]